MRDMTEANRAEFESFMAERFTDSIDRRRCINGDGNDYMSWDMGVARAVWQHMQQKLDAVLAENAKLEHFAESAECVNLCLDNAGVTKERNGQALSLWGRVVEYSRQLRAETDTTPSQYESLAGGK